MAELLPVPTLNQRKVGFLDDQQGPSPADLDRLFSSGALNDLTPDQALAIRQHRQESRTLGNMAKGAIPAILQVGSDVIGGLTEAGSLLASPNPVQRSKFGLAGIEGAIRGTADLGKLSSDIIKSRIIDPLRIQQGASPGEIARQRLLEDRQFKEERQAAMEGRESYLQDLVTAGLSYVPGLSDERVAQLSEYVRPPTKSSELISYVADPMAVVPAGAGLKAGTRAAQIADAANALRRSSVSNAFGAQSRLLQDALDPISIAAQPRPTLAQRAAGGTANAMQKAADVVETGVEKLKPYEKPIKAIGTGVGLLDGPLGAMIGYKAPDAINLVGAAARKSRNLGEALRAFSRADFQSRIPVWMQIAKSKDAPAWLKKVVGTRVGGKEIAPLIEEALRMVPATAKGAATGSAIGTGLMAADPYKTGEEIGAGTAVGAVLGGVGGPFTSIASRNERIAVAAAYDKLRFVDQAIKDGADPQTVLAASAATLDSAVVLQTLFQGAFPGQKSLTIKLVGPNDPNARDANGNTVAAKFDQASLTAFINVATPDADGRLLHETLGHGLMASYLQNNPNIVSTIDGMLTPDQIQNAKIDYAKAILGDTADQALINSYIRNNDNFDPYWVHQEIFSEAVAHNLRGQDLLAGVKTMLGRTNRQTFFKDADVRNIVFSDTMRDVVSEEFQALRNFIPGTDKGKTRGMKLREDMAGNHKGFVIDDLPDGTRGNDFVTVTTDGRAVARPQAQVRRRVRSRQREMSQFFPDQDPVRYDEDSGTVRNRTTPSGRNQKTGTKLPQDWYDNSLTFAQSTKDYARTIQDVIENGGALAGFYQQVIPRTPARIRDTMGGMEVQFKDFIPYAFKVDGRYNILVENYSLTALNRKAQQWLEAGTRDNNPDGVFNMRLWGNDLDAFRADVKTYLDNHANNRPGATGLGDEKRNLINAFLVGNNNTFGESNPLRANLVGDNRAGIIRSYRLDRLQTVEPSALGGYAQPRYRSQLENLSPEMTQTMEIVTKLTPAGEKFANLLDQATASNNRTALKLGDEVVLRNLKALTDESGEGNPITQLFRAMTGDKTGPGKIELGYGTFEGDMSRNIRIPLDKMPPNMREAFLAYLGEPYKQAAQAASNFTFTNDPNPTTYTVVLDGVNTEAPALKPFVESLSAYGHEANIIPRGDKLTVDVNPKFLDDGSLQPPNYSALSSLVSKFFPGVVSKITGNEYDSIYIERSGYAEAISRYEQGLNNESITQGTSRDRSSDLERRNRSRGTSAENDRRGVRGIGVAADEKLRNIRAATQQVEAAAKRLESDTEAVNPRIEQVVREGETLPVLNVRNEDKFPYADQIVNGQKTIETRTHTRLDGLIGKGPIKIARTTDKGAGQIIGEVEIVGRVDYPTLESFQADASKHLVSEGSQFDFTRPKFGYVLANPIRYKEPYPAKNPRGRIYSTEQPGPRYSPANANITADSPFKRVGQYGISTKPGLISFSPMMAYHGTPHAFDQFSTEYINTGEGAQAFGWGLYFAQDRGVAKAYRQRLAPSYTETWRIGPIDLFEKGIMYDYSDLPNGERYLIEMLFIEEQRFVEAFERGGIDEAKSEVIDYLDYMVNLWKDSSPDVSEAAKRMIEDVRKDFSFSRRDDGNLYKVELDVSPDELLLWDRDISEQHPRMFNAILGIASDYGITRENAPQVFLDTYKFNPNQREADSITAEKGSPRSEQEIKNRLAYLVRFGESEGFKGQHVYEELAEIFRSDERASSALAEYGVLGVRYDDGQSRAKDVNDRTHNYVIFDDQYINIVPIPEAELQGRYSPEMDPMGPLPSGEGAVLTRVPTPILKGDTKNVTAFDKIKTYIDKNKNDKVRDNTKFEDGKPVGIRIDIPTFQRSVAKDDATFVQSVHEPWKGQERGKAGTILGYTNIATVENPRFSVNEHEASMIATGEHKKNPIATVEGIYRHTKNVPEDIDTWTQTGFNPKRHSYFYDRATGEPVIGGDMAISTGNTVFVKNPIFADKSQFLFSPELDSNSINVSTRYPTAVKRAEDPTKNLLLSDYGAYLDAPELLDANFKLMRAYPNFNIRQKNALKGTEIMIEHMVKNLLWLHDNYNPTYRQEATKWYPGARGIVDRWTKKYPLKDVQLAGATAALSPQKNWYMNVSLVERMVDIFLENQNFAWTKKMDATMKRIFNPNKVKKESARATRQALLKAIQGKTLAELMPTGSNKNYVPAAAYIRVFSETYHDKKFQLINPDGEIVGWSMNNDGVTPTKVTWGSNSEIAKALAMLADGSIENISKQLGLMHKIRNFFNNIVDPDNPAGFVTMDTHAIAAALLRPFGGSSKEVGHNFGTATKNSSVYGIKGVYPVFGEAYRRAAAERGILPRAMQSITWEAVRSMFPQAWKTKKTQKAVDAIWREYKKGIISHDEAIQKVSDFAGGIKNPSWAGSSGRLLGEPGTTTYERLLP